MACSSSVEISGRQELTTRPTRTISSRSRWRSANVGGVQGLSARGAGWCAATPVVPGGTARARAGGASGLGPSAGAHPSRTPGHMPIAKTTERSPRQSGLDGSAVMAQPLAGRGEVPQPGAASSTRHSVTPGVMASPFAADRTHCLRASSHPNSCNRGRITFVSNSSLLVIWTSGSAMVVALVNATFGAPSSRLYPKNVPSSTRGF